jgi:HEPN domain-containing protein
MLDAEVLLKNRCYAAAYYLAGYAVECGLKACIARQTKQYDFPPAERIVHDIYTHDLEKLVKSAGLRPELETEIQKDGHFGVNWGLVKDWSERSRYQTYNGKQAEDFIDAIRDPDHGVQKMDKPVLVEADMDAGHRLVGQLDKAGLKVTAAFWFYMTDSDEWRLILAMPIVDDEGPKRAYEKVQDQLKSLAKHELSLQNISVVSPNDDLIKLLSSAINTGPGISHMRFTRNVINSVFIEDAYIYRLQRASA